MVSFIGVAICNPMPHEKLCGLEFDNTGDLIRHIEQLWDETKKLKERVKILEKRFSEIPEK